MLSRYPIFSRSCIACILLVVCLLYAGNISGVQYHEAYAHYLNDDDLMAAQVRRQMEKANLTACLYGYLAVVGVFMMWWVACAFVVFKRVKAAGYPRFGYCYGLTVLPLIALNWWGHCILESRPPVYDYNAYVECVLAAMGAAGCGVVLSCILVLGLYQWCLKKNCR